MRSPIALLAGAVCLTLAASVAGPVTASAAPLPEPRIVGGSDASITEVPWQVALLGSAQPIDYQAQFCGGSIVAPRAVVTAAHCVSDGTDVALPGDIQVLAGVTDLSTTGSSGVPRIDVQQIDVHSGYNDATHENDVAVLTLASAIPLDGTTMKAIALPAAAEPAAWPTTTDNGTISGWGDLASGAMDYPTHLQKATVQIAANPGAFPCGSYDARYYPASMLCAGPIGGGIDTCQGDSGGPLAVPLGPSATMTLAGITSWGDGCAIPNYPGIYTRVTHYADWINGRITAAPAPATPPGPSSPSSLVVDGVTATWDSPVYRNAACTTYPIRYANNHAGTMRTIRFSISPPGGSDIAAQSASDVPSGATGTLNIGLCPENFTAGDGPYVFRLTTQRSAVDGGIAATAYTLVTFVAPAPAPAPFVPGPAPEPTPTPAPVVRKATSFTDIALVPARPRAGRIARIRARLVAPEDTVGPAAGTEVVGWFKRKDRTYKRVGTATTSSTSVVVFRFRPRGSGVFKFQYAGSTDFFGSTAKKKVRVR